ncbi:uncharacterized protein EI90DRAFT_3069229 [Cantharellus anzutake]|uniref:uncharacterized protein n=1 Tax=Cantharellus anzutake TaxID=1750568 RepID=UPI001903398F|nr:uncharacterized protein EI90DRAFT_3069229 [Cantharellus anzutake]KAF8326842.1 hypothetical protein EI90DRAFT_3069229 [Cantharellus anzutake]
MFVQQRAANGFLRLLWILSQHFAPAGKVTPTHTAKKLVLVQQHLAFPALGALRSLNIQMTPQTSSATQLSVTLKIVDLRMMGYHPG